MRQTDLYQFLSEAKYSWFNVRGIKIPNDYSVYDERNMLSTLFTFSNLKAYGGADLQEISNRLTNAKRKSIIPVYEICESVERSNYLKRKTRILEGSKARVESHNVGLSLIAAELVISVAGLYHTLNGWSGPESPFNLSDIRIFVPA